MIFITDHPYLCAWMCAIALILFIFPNTPKEKKMLEAKATLEEASDKVHKDLKGAKNEEQLETARQYMERFRILYGEAGVNDYNALCVVYNKQFEKFQELSSEKLPLNEYRTMTQNSWQVKYGFYNPNENG